MQHTTPPRARTRDERTTGCSPRSRCVTRATNAWWPSHARDPSARGTRSCVATGASCARTARASSGRAAPRTRSSRRSSRPSSRCETASPARSRCAHGSTGSHTTAPSTCCARDTGTTSNSTSSTTACRSLRCCSSRRRRSRDWSRRCELPDAQRQALTLRELEGRSYEEISTRLGHSGSGVRQLIFRARTTLRNGVAALLPFGALRDGSAGPAVECHHVAIAAVPASSGGGLDTVGAAALAVVAVLGGVAGGVRAGDHHRRPRGPGGTPQDRWRCGVARRSPRRDRATRCARRPGPSRARWRAVAGARSGARADRPAPRAGRRALAAVAPQVAAPSERPGARASAGPSPHRRRKRPVVQQQSLTSAAGGPATGPTQSPPAGYAERNRVSNRHRGRRRRSQAAGPAGRLRRPAW